MAAAVRFIFQTDGPLGFFSGDAYRRPAAPLTTALRDPRVIAFLVIWFGLNLLFGVGSITIGNEQQSVAWEAHIGGFLAGLLLFPLFDPIGKGRALPSDDDAAKGAASG
jgi:membrane associated rhomboid family serine protease